MQAVIDGKEIEVRLIDVVIGHDTTDEFSRQLHAFFCPYCHYHQPLLQFMGGRIIAITPGHAPLKFPIIKRCSGCKRNYSFNGIS